MKKKSIEITPVAIETLKTFKGVKLGIGCSSCNNTVSYSLDINEYPEKTDLTIQHDGIKFFVSPQNIQFIQDIQIDFVKNEYGKTFVIESPYGVSNSWV